MIHWSDLRMDYDKNGNLMSGEIVFSHVDDVTGVVRHFAIERITKDIEKMAVPPPIIEIPIDPVFAHFAMVHRGVEMHRWNRITPSDLCHYPIMLAYMPGIARDTKDSHLIIDGIHRYTRAASWGWTSIRAYELQPSFWEPYLVWIPEELNAMDRERLENQHVRPIDSHIG